MEEERRELIKKFYRIYRPLQKKYNLRMHSHFSIYDDGRIKIWEYTGEVQGRCICTVKEREEINCYKRAIEELESYGKSREERLHEKRAV